MIYNLHSLESQFENIHLYFRSGSFEIAEADGVARGTKITVHLKDLDKRFALKSVVEGMFNLFHHRSLASKM